jgi:hypothetical protein
MRRVLAQRMARSSSPLASQQGLGRPLLAGDRLPDRLDRPGQGAGAEVEAGDQPRGDGRGDLGEGAAGAAAEVDHVVAGAGRQQPGQPAVPARHDRLGHAVDVVRFARRRSKR